MPRCRIVQVELGTLPADNVLMGLAELDRQLAILESLIGQERPQTRDQWRRYVSHDQRLALQHVDRGVERLMSVLLPARYRKIQDLRNESDFFKGVVNRHVRSRTREQREMAEREELLARRNAVSTVFFGGMGVTSGLTSFVASLSCDRACPRLWWTNIWRRAPPTSAPLIW